MHSKTRAKLSKDVMDIVRSSLEGEYTYDEFGEEGRPSEFQEGLVKYIFKYMGDSFEGALYDALGNLSVEVNAKNKKELTEAKKEIKELQERLKAFESIDEVFTIAKKAS